MPDPGLPSAQHRRTRSTLVTPLVWWLAQALVVIEVVVATRNFTFFQDDFLFLAQARGDQVHDGVLVRPPLTIEYLRLGLFEHFSPVTRWLFWLVGGTDSPLPWARLIVLVLVGALVVSLAELCRAVLDRTIGALLVSMIAGQGLIVVHLASWTTAGFNLVPALALSALSLAAAIRYLRELRSSWHAVASVALLSLAALDYELAMVLPVFIGLWFLLCVGPDLGWSGILARIRHTFGYWAALALVSGAAALNFKVNYQLPGLPRPSVRDVIGTVWHSGWQGVFPSSLGVSNVEPGATGALGVLAVLVWVVALALGLQQVGLRMLGPAALGLLGWLVCTLILAVGRTAINGTMVGIDLFYAAFPLVVLVLAVAEGLRLARGVDPEERAVRLHRSIVAALALITLVSAGLTQSGSHEAADPNKRSSSAKKVIDTFLADVAAQLSPPSVVSTPVPELVVLSNFFPYNYGSRSIGVFTDRVRWDDAGSGPLFRVDDQGHLVEVGVVPVRRANLSSVEAHDAQRLSGTRCLTMTTASSRVRFSLDTPVTGQNLTIQLEGSIDRDSAAVPLVIANPTTALAATGSITQWGRGPLHAVFYPPTTTVAGVEISGLLPGTTLCVDSVTVGQLVDVARG